jgi:hypothetical protein
MSQDLADEDVQLLMALDRVKAKDFGEVPVMLEGLDDRGIVGLAAPFVEAWARFGAGGNKAIEEAITRIKTHAHSVEIGAATSRSPSEYVRGPVCSVSHTYRAVRPPTPPTSRARLETDERPRRTRR